MSNLKFQGFRQEIAPELGERPPFENPLQESAEEHSVNRLRPKAPSRSWALWGAQRTDSPTAYFRMHLIFGIHENPAHPKI